MTDMLTSRPLDKAFNFNMENIFEYIDQMLHYMNVDISGEQTDRILQNLCKYIESLPLTDAGSAVLEVESMVNEALSETSQYAYKAGFMEACRLMRTLQSF